MIPRLLPLKDAAAYMGLRPRAFRRSVPVPAVKLGNHDLWDRQALDAYVDGLQGLKAAQPDNWDEDEAAKNF